MVAAAAAPEERRPVPFMRGSWRSWVEVEREEATARRDVFSSTLANHARTKLEARGGRPLFFSPKILARTLPP